MPSYGVVGTLTDTVTTFNRAIALDIVHAEPFRRGEVEKIYEGRTTSRGRCSIIAEVFDEMLYAMFSEFPGPNGRNQKKEVPGDFNC